MRLASPALSVDGFTAFLPQVHDGCRQEGAGGCGPALGGAGAQRSQPAALRHLDRCVAARALPHSRPLGACPRNTRACRHGCMLQRARLPAVLRRLDASSQAPAWLLIAPPRSHSHSTCIATPPVAGTAMGGMATFATAVESLCTSYKKMNPFCIPFAIQNMGAPAATGQFQRQRGVGCQPARSLHPGPWHLCPASLTQRCPSFPADHLRVPPSV